MKDVWTNWQNNQDGFEFISTIFTIIYRNTFVGRSSLQNVSTDTIFIICITDGIISYSTWNQCHAAFQCSYMTLQQPVFFWGGPTTSFVPAEYFLTFELDLELDFFDERWFPELESILILSEFSCWLLDERTFFPGALGWVGALAFDFLEEPFFSLFLLLEVFSNVVGDSVFWLWNDILEFKFNDWAGSESPTRLILAALLFGPFGDDWFTTAFDELSWFGLCCFTLDIERCFLRSDNVCDWGCEVVEIEFKDVCEFPLICAGVKELEARILFSGDIFSGDEDGTSWFVTFTVTWLLREGEEFKIWPTLGLPPFASGNDVKNNCA